MIAKVNVVLTVGGEVLDPVCGVQWDTHDPPEVLSHQLATLSRLISNRLVPLATRINEAVTDEMTKASKEVRE